MPPGRELWLLCCNTRVRTCRGLQATFCTAQMPLRLDPRDLTAVATCDSASVRVRRETRVRMRAMHRGDYAWLYACVCAP